MKDDPLLNMLDAADKNDLIFLITKLAQNDLSIYRMCIDYLQQQVTVSSSIHDSAESSAALTLWYEIEPELSELDQYGGADYSTEREVVEGLHELYNLLEKVTLTEDDREELLDEVLLYIKSSNSGMDDSLYDIAYSICKTNNELRELAERFEDLKRDWPIDHARRIYRKIGDHKKYLELRSLKMRYGLDYYDLVSFYWEIGEKQKAISKAEEGIKKAEGRMDELRMFLAERAKDSGDRETYLNYLFSQKMEQFTLSSYKEFVKECSVEEWSKYEPKILNILKKNFNIQAVKIHLYRKEYKTALQFFQKPMRATYAFKFEVFSVAKELETRYPTQILEFYKSSIGNLNLTASRKTYAANAIAVERVRRVLVDVMNKTEEWKKYALSIKSKNINRPAFQDEFKRVIPDWEYL